MTRRWSRLLRSGESNDGGFTLVEMVISLLIVAIVFPIATLVIRNLLTQSQAATALVASMQQDETAGQLLVEYLQTATSIATSSTASSLIAELDVGYSLVSGSASATLQANCSTAGQSAGVEQLTIELISSNGQATTTQIYDLEAPANGQACQLFDYATGNGGAGLSWQATASAATVAVGIDATFLANDTARSGSGFDRTSTLATTVYLDNPAITPATTVP